MHMRWHWTLLVVVVAMVGVGLWLLLSAPHHGATDRDSSRDRWPQRPPSLGSPGLLPHRAPTPARAPGEGDESATPAAQPDVRTGSARTISFRVIDAGSGSVVKSAHVDLAGVWPTPWRLVSPSVEHAVTYVVPMEVTLKSDAYVSWFAPGYLGGRRALAELLAETSSPTIVSLPATAADRDVIRIRFVASDSKAPLDAVGLYSLSAFRAHTPLALSARDGVLEAPLSQLGGSGRRYAFLDGYLPREVSIGPHAQDLGTQLLLKDTLLGSLSIELVPNPRFGNKWGGRIVVRYVAPEQNVDAASHKQSMDLTTAEKLAAAIYSNAGPEWRTTACSWSRTMLLPGHYYIMASHPSLGWAGADLELLGTNETLALQLKPGSTVRFDRPMQDGEYCQLQPLDPGRLDYACRHGDRIENVPPGRYDVTVTSTRGSLARGEAIDVREGELLVDARVPYETGQCSITGRIMLRSSRGDTPLSGANVQVVGATSWTSTDAGGRFEIPDLAPGDYVLRIKGYTPLSISGWRVSIPAPMTAAERQDAGDLVVR